MVRYAFHKVVHGFTPRIITVKITLVMHTMTDLAKGKLVWLIQNSHVIMRHNTTLCILASQHQAKSPRDRSNCSVHCDQITLNARVLYHSRKGVNCKSCINSHYRKHSNKTSQSSVNFIKLTRGNSFLVKTN